MYLENVVFDATDPQALGRFWESELGTETLTDQPEGYETRLAVPDGPVLDLCFQRVPEPPTGPQRLHLELAGGGEGRRGSRADPEGNPFRVVEPRTAYGDRGPVTALVLAVADPDRDRMFWSWLTGWTHDAESGTLQHATRRGPVLALRPEAEPKRAGKNRIHLDVRLEPGEDADAVGWDIADRGGRELRTDWGDLPWRSYLDPSGNEFCVLPAPR
ncbi:MAG TPA: VOC family protein [Nocardioides sp.]|nr:VOC family protein [Nocardioides sp.]